MNPLTSSLYWRVLLSFCAATLLTLLLGGFLAKRFVEYSTAVEINWAALAQGANEAYESGGETALAAWSEQQRHEGIEATLYEHGQPLVPLRRFSPGAQDTLQTWLDTGRDVVVQPFPGLYLAVQQAQGTDGQMRQLVALSRTHSRMRPRTRESINLAVQCVLSLLFIALIGWWVARGVAKPVEAIRQAAQRMATGDLSARAGLHGRHSADELTQLARDFDAMAERIEALVTHDRRVLQDLSHELRSPLARLHLILDLAQRSDSPDEAARYFQQAEGEIERLDQMTGEMLALSRLEGGIPGMQREPVELQALVQRCLQRAEVEATARQISMTLQPSSTATVSGSTLLLERALDNLIANAIKFSPIGGSVQLSLQSVQGMARLAIRDHGPGVPVDELESMFRPLFRGTNASRADGHGLGLAIARRVVHAHGGNITAQNADGGGLVVNVQVPLAAG